MRRTTLQRKGVSTMIGGIIVLTLLLTALVAIVFVTRQYDFYQGTSGQMQRMEIDRFSESLEGVFPGISTGTPDTVTNCGSAGANCGNYTLLLNSHGIGARVVRIYINATVAPGCVTLCVLDEHSGAGPMPYKFRALDHYVNAGEFLHPIVFWLPSSVTLPATCPSGGTTINHSCNTISVVTERGRVFSFQWPFPPTGFGVGSGNAGGTGIYIGPLVYTFQKTLITYTTASQTSPQIPIYGTDGYWTLPTGNLVIYIKVQTDVDVPNDVYLTAQSVFEIARFDSPGSVNFFFIIAPITLTLCDTFRSLEIANLGSTDIVCDAAYGYNVNGNTGNPNTIVPYLACNQPPATYNSANCATPRYMVPKPDPVTQQGQRGNPVILAFAARTVSGSNPQTIQGAWAGNSVTSFLGLTYVYDDDTGTGPYVFGVTLPFVAACINNSPTKCNG